MALSKARYKAALKALFETKIGFGSITDSTQKDLIRAEWEKIADAVTDADVAEYIGNAVVNTALDTSLNVVFTAGVPVPLDGGAVLQAAWKAATAGGAADGSTGGVS